MRIPSSPDDDTPPSQLVDEESARRILRHAAELDAAQRDAVTLDELRQAAIEAGIAADAFDAAVRKVAPVPTAFRQGEFDPDHALVPPRDPLPVQVVASAGLIIGVLCGWIDTLPGSTDALLFAPLGTGALISLLIALYDRRGARLRRFAREHLALWASVIGGVWLADPNHWLVIWDDVLTVVGGIAAGTGVLGAAIVAGRLVSEQAVPQLPAATGPGDGPGTPTMRRRLGAVARRMGLGRLFPERVESTSVNVHAQALV